MTSLREGFPNALSEAMAVGLPSIAIKCHEGLAELIQDGKNGFLIEEGNEDRFVEVAMTLIEDESLRESIGIRAAKSTEKYNYNKIVSIWNECISELLVN
jgi:glycosyltransferase involved in cell wall biosynthesis